MEILKIAALALCAVMIIVLVKNYKPEFGIFVADGDVVEIEVAQIVIPIDTRRHERSGEEQQGKGSHRDKC